MPVNQHKIGWLPATWHAPAHVHAGTTTRTGGISPAPYESFNLADHVGDNPAYVEHNRKLLCHGLSLDGSPCWLQQMHGNRIINIAESCVEPLINQQGDGSYTCYKHRICAVLTADCLPLLMCNGRGTEISAIHIGWRGYSENIITSAVTRFTSPACDLMAWIGPCISAKYYEVGPEVHTTCTRVTGDPAIGFTAIRNKHWLADLVALVKFQLQVCGVTNIHGGDHCTHAEADQFYSFRRDGVTGRMASLIWME